MILFHSKKLKPKLIFFFIIAIAGIYFYQFVLLAYQNKWIHFFGRNRFSIFQTTPNSQTSGLFQTNGLTMLLFYLKSTQSPKCIGLLNFPEPESQVWKEVLPSYSFENLPFEPISGDLEWHDIYPLSNETKDCPMPNPLAWASEFPYLDAVSVRIPCTSKNVKWGEDVMRHYFSLLTAALVSISIYEEIPVLILSECRPLPNLFHCSELKLAFESTWLYLLNVRRMREHMAMPVGSCETALKSSIPPRLHKSEAKEAYVTSVVGSGIFVCGAISLAHSIRRSGSTRDLVVLLDDSIPEPERQALQTAGWKLRFVPRLTYPKSAKVLYCKWCFSKLHLWELTDYERVLYMDVDVLVLRNLDVLFDLPELSASTDATSRQFNSALMLLQPSRCTFDYLMQQRKNVFPYEEEDQGFLNEVFTWWHRLPPEFNFMKTFSHGSPEEIQSNTETIQTNNQPMLFSTRYMEFKPWTCRSNASDCNTQFNGMETYRNDSAHQVWWEVFETWSEEEKSFCLGKS